VTEDEDIAGLTPADLEPLCDGTLDKCQLPSRSPQERAESKQRFIEGYGKACEALEAASREAYIRNHETALAYVAIAKAWNQISY
jgi:hypothetical protein